MHPHLTIHLRAVLENYRRLNTRFTGSQTAAVVKANAYGLGADVIAKVLEKAQAPWFFVASLQEAIDLRNAGIQAKIAVFHGPFSGEEAAFIEHDLTPAINHIAQLERWMLITAHHPSADYMLHLDTGMCRLGLTQSEINWLVAHGQKLLVRRPLYILSHLACANDPDDPKNREQLARLQEALPFFQGIPVSFCNSSGIYLPPEFHEDLARPGSALYGINPTPYQPNPMEQVAELSAPIIMIRQLDREETIGYGATYRAAKGDRIGIVQIGYADGLLRCLSNRGSAYVGEIGCPVVGRVSMDMIAVNLSRIPERDLSAGMMVDLICRHQTVDQLAAQAETIGYEVFTRLGGRLERRYID